MNKGDRVGAILGADYDNDTVKVLGYGTFQGYEVPPPDGGWIAQALHNMKQTNAKILLDTGEVVWGCQCWWGPEGQVKEKVERFKDNGWIIKQTTIAAALEKAKAEESLG